MTISLTSLPSELIIHILSYLDVSDLHSIGDTCQWLSHIINDDELWKKLFTKKYNTSDFSSSSGSSKFSVELFKRNNLIHSWKKANGLHRNIVVNSPSIEKLIFNYPKVLAFSNQGSMCILSVDRNNTEVTIPMTTPSGCTAYSFNASASVFGRWDGKIFGKLLASRSYLSSMTKFDRQHEGMVTAIYNNDMYCFSGDEKGQLYVWDLKNGTFIKDYNISTESLLQIKVANNYIITIDTHLIYVLANGQTRTMEHNEGVDFFEIDFGGKLIIVGNQDALTIYSFDDHSFGKRHKLPVSDKVHCIAIENKSERDLKLAGHDGCNFGVVTKAGQVLIVNVRTLKLNKEDSIVPQIAFTPIFDNLKIPEGFPSINAIAVNSTVVLLGSYNGYAATYDILTGNFIKLASSRIPKRYLSLDAPPHLVPVKHVELGYKDETNGLIAVSNVVQYFQFGELQHASSSNSKKKKKNIVGATSDRKDNMRKLIKHEFEEIDHQEYQNYQEEKLLNKYNGEEIGDEEQIQLAMVLNASLQDQSTFRSKATGKETEIIDSDMDRELEEALELSKLDNNNRYNPVYDGPGNGSSSQQVDIVEPLDKDLALALELSRLEDSNSGNRIDALESISRSKDTEIDFDEQLEEALRRSLYE